MAYFRKGYIFKGKTVEERIAKKILKEFPPRDFYQKEEKDFKVISE